VRQGGEARGDERVLALSVRVVLLLLHDPQNDLQNNYVFCMTGVLAFVLEALLEFSSDLPVLGSKYTEYLEPGVLREDG